MCSGVWSAGGEYFVHYLSTTPPLKTNCCRLRLALLPLRQIVVVQVLVKMQVGKDILKDVGLP